MSVSETTFYINTSDTNEEESQRTILYRNKICGGNGCN